VNRDAEDQDGRVGVGEMGSATPRICGDWCRVRELMAIADCGGGAGEAVAEELEIEHAFGGLDAMLEYKGLQAVLIATPDKFHAQAVVQAAKAGKDILCEKPLALTMMDALCGAGCGGQGGCARCRWDLCGGTNPAYAAAMKRIEAGEIGTPLIFKSWGGTRMSRRWRPCSPAVNGMLLYSNTIHDFDWRGG